MFKSLSRSVEWMPLWNFDFKDKSLIANEQKTAFLHNTGILLRKINQTMQKNVFYEIFVHNNQFIYKIQFSSLKTISPIMLSGEWLTMMLSSVGPVNSLGYRSVTIMLSSVGPVYSLGYRLITVMLSSVGPVNSLGYRSVTIIFSSVGPVNILGYRSETMMLCSVGPVNSLGYRSVTIMTFVGPANRLGYR